LLHAVGAMRCPSDMHHCSTGCITDGHFDGEPPKSGIPTTPKYSKKGLFNILTFYTDRWIDTHGDVQIDMWTDRSISR